MSMGWVGGGPEPSVLCRFPRNIVKNNAAQSSTARVYSVKTVFFPETIVLPHPWLSLHFASYNDTSAYWRNREFFGAAAIMRHNPGVAEADVGINMDDPENISHGNGEKKKCSQNLKTQISFR